VHFEIVQEIKAKRSAVLAAVADPHLYESMGATKSLSPPEVLDCTKSGPVTSLRIRFRYAGGLSGAARAILDPAKMTWVVELDVDADDRGAEFKMVPDYYPDRIDASGTYRFDKGDKTTTQVMEGGLVVHVPLVASTVERAIVSGFREHMAEEAAAIERFTA
jgi:Protein of unknown function (DUF2505)